MSATKTRQISPAIAAFQDVHAAAYHVSDAPEATVAVYVATLKSIEKPPRGMDDTEMEQLDIENRLSTKLARTDPTTNLELLTKTELAIVGLLRSLEDGENQGEIDLGVGALRDVRAAIRTNQADRDSYLGAKTTCGDADLIALCNRLVAIRAEQEDLAIVDPLAPDDGLLSAEYHNLHGEWVNLVDRLQVAAAPTTPEGVRAAARMAWDTAGRDRRDRVTSSSPMDWVRLTAIAWAAGETLLPKLPPFWLGERLLDGEVVE
jgi:hypothetical protein